MEKVTFEINHDRQVTDRHANGSEVDFLGGRQCEPKPGTNK